MRHLIWLVSLLPIKYLSGGGSSIPSNSFLLLNGNNFGLLNGDYLVLL